MDLARILEKVVAHKAPDIHLKVGRPPIVRLPNGELFEIEGLAALQADHILTIAQKIMSAEKYTIFSTT